MKKQTDFINELNLTINDDYNLERYYKLIELYYSLSEKEREQIDLIELEQQILYNVECGSISFNIINLYCKKVNPEFRKKVNDMIEEKCIDTELLCEYISKNNLDNEKYINLSLKAIQYAILDNKKQIEQIEKLRQ